MVGRSKRKRNDMNEDTTSRDRGSEEPSDTHRHKRERMSDVVQRRDSNVSRLCEVFESSHSSKSPPGPRYSPAPPPERSPVHFNPALSPRYSPAPPNYDFQDSSPSHDEGLPKAIQPSSGSDGDDEHNHLFRSSLTGVEVQPRGDSSILNELQHEIDQEGANDERPHWLNTSILRTGSRAASITGPSKAVRITGEENAAFNPRRPVRVADGYFEQHRQLAPVDQRIQAWNENVDGNQDYVPRAPTITSLTDGASVITFEHRHSIPNEATPKERLAMLKLLRRRLVQLANARENEYNYRILITQVGARENQRKQQEEEQGGGGAPDQTNGAGRASPSPEAFCW